MRTASQEFGATAGVSALTHAIRLSISRPAVRRRVLAGFMLTSVLFAALLYGLVLLIFSVTEGWALDVWWLASAAWLLRVAVCVAVLPLAPTLFVMVGHLLLAPLCETLFVAGRRAAGAPEGGGAGTSMVGSARATLGRLTRLVVWSVVLCPLLLIPGAGPLVHAPLQLLVTGYFMGWELLSLHFEHHGVQKQAERAFVRRNKAGVLGLGVAATLLSLVPVLQLWFATTHLVAAGVLSARLDARG